jgi:hypothetical protein
LAGSVWNPAGRAPIIVVVVGIVPAAVVPIIVVVMGVTVEYVIVPVIGTAVVAAGS